MMILSNLTTLLRQQSYYSLTTLLKHLTVKLICGPNTKLFIILIHKFKEDLQATKFCSTRITGFHYSHLTVRVMMNDLLVTLLY